MRYYINGKQKTSTQAKECASNGYLMQGGDPEEFAIVWANHHDDEQARELLNEWSGYTLEILTDEEDEAIDD